MGQLRSEPGVKESYRRAKHANAGMERLVEETKAVRAKPNAWRGAAL